MSELGSSVVDRVSPRPMRFVLPTAAISTPLSEAFSVLLLCPILLSVALWNGFPIIFYDTGAYMLQGLGHVFLAERSPVYSLFLEAAGGHVSLWLVAITQCAMTAFVITQFARALRPSLSLWSLLAIVTFVSIASGLPWYAAQIEPDCFVALIPLGLYLFAFHPSALGRVRGFVLFLVITLATASHPSHIGLSAALLAALWLVRFAPRSWIEESGLPRPRVILATASLVIAISTVVACNYAYTRQVFLSRSGAIFLEARIMGDGLIKPVLDATCPQGHYKLCAYRNKLPTRADTWLWEPWVSPFQKLGGFAKREPEAAALIAESLKRYPMQNLIMAIKDAALQFFWFQTGDGIVPQEWVLNREFKLAIPQQLSDYDHAYQQEGAIWFVPVNIVHVPVAFIALGALGLLLARALKGGDWRNGLLPAFVLLALIGNAFVCGVFSGPHGRYQSRMMWLPALSVVLIVWPKVEGESRARRLARSIAA
jgi:hypothetical protein